MSRTFTVTAEFTLEVDDEQAARNRLGLYTVGIPGCDGFRITSVRESTRCAWDDDVEARAA